MIAIYLAIVNIIVDCKISRIVIFINLTKKILKIVKEVRLDIIYEYTDAVYIIIDILRVLIVLIATTAVASITNLFIFI